MKSIQEQYFENHDDNFIMSPGEYEGPLEVNRSCTIDGCNSTLWANNGPVLKITAEKVTVKNLHIEVTGSSNNLISNVAIETTDENTKFDNVEINGNLHGISGEEQDWNIPGTISLGEFAANEKNNFVVKINSPSNAVIENHIKGLIVSPSELSAGENSLTFSLDEQRNNTIIYGELKIKTAVSRRIYVIGKALNTAPIHNDIQPIQNEPIVSLPVQMDSPTEIIAPNISNENIKTIKKGQRISVSELQTSRIKIAYEHQSAEQGVDIDGYCFMLTEKGIVSRDEDLIFFGNTESIDKSVKVTTIDDKPLVLMNLESIDASVNKVAVCFSIYGDVFKFSDVKSPSIRIFGGDKEAFRFELNDLSEENTVVGIELYRYKGEWKINFVGAGYINGLKKLCESYGVNIAD